MISADTREERATRATQGTGLMKTFLASLV